MVSSGLRQANGAEVYGLDTAADGEVLLQVDASIYHPIYQEPPESVGTGRYSTVLP